MRAITLCTFLVLAACEDRDPNTDDTGSDPVDTGTADVEDTDTGDTDTDTDTDTEPPEPVADVAGDTCASADVLYTGHWEVAGSLTGFGNNFNSACTTGAPGRDAVIDIRLEVGEYLYARYDLVDGDGVMYAIESCATPNTCMDWSEEAGVEEIVLHPEDVARDASLVLDARDATTEGAFTVRVEIGAPETLGYSATCDGEPVRQGVHDVVLVRAFNDADLAGASTSCTGFPKSAGVDSRVPVDVPPGATLSATWSARQADGVLYLLSECGDVDTCVAGSDRSMYGGPESVRWVNDSAETRRMTLILDAFDTDSGKAGGTLSVHVF